MCGIAGLISFGAPFTDTLVMRRMGDAIAHRGPDDEGYFFFENSNKTATHCYGSTTPKKARGVSAIDIADCNQSFSIGFAHRRFSIIDLSVQGHQPFIDPTGRWCMVYNGEVYNYKEIRDELRNRGISFVSTSDTEVVLAAFAMWGVGCFARFNGFWALAIYDRIEQTVVLSRDRIGKKPLFYHLDNDALYFASEIKSLLTVDTVECGWKVNDAAVWDWLAYGKKDLDGSTFFSTIQQFPRASYAVVSRQGMTQPVTFWRLPQERLSVKELPVDNAVKTVRELVHDAVALRLRSDVPVGIELSGGLDSSVIAAAVAAAGGVVPAFTIGFDDPAYDEFPFAQHVAERCGLPLQLLKPDNRNFWQHVAAFTRLQEEPYHLPNLFTNQEIWVAMRTMGIKVSLNGAGGDESFGGYPAHFWCAQIEHLFTGNVRQFVNNARAYSEVGSPFMRWLGCIPYSVGRRLLDYFPMLSRKYRLHVAPHNRRHLSTPLRLSQRVLYEMDRSLMPYWLVSGDRDYMGMPMEVREPLLDYRVIECAFRLPIEYLVRDGWHKWIVRKAFEHELPTEVVWRKNKMGFPFPLRTFLEENRATVTQLTPSLPPQVSLRAPVHTQDWKMISYLLWHAFFVDKQQGVFAEVERMHATAESARGFVPAYYG